MANSSVKVKSFVRGYHVYKDVAGWNPEINEERILKREPNNVKDKNAVAVVRPQTATGSLLDSQSLERRSCEETTNTHPNTVDVHEDEILGHIPLRMTPFVSKFLKRPTNKGELVVSGKRVNRGAGYGLEIPCIYTFSGDKLMSIPWLRSKIESLNYDIVQ